MGFKFVIVESKFLGQKCSVHCGCGNRLTIGFAALMRIGKRIEKYYPDAHLTEEDINDSMKVKRFKVTVTTKKIHALRKIYNLILSAECMDCGESLTADVTSRFEEK